MRDIALCAPDIYYDTEMQDFICRRCEDEDKQWIYRIIANPPVQDENEVVYIREPEWVLCKDIHQGADFRMLVLFCDRQLQTLRDLRGKHINLLLDMERKVREWLCTQMHAKQASKYMIYFHYMPSVYQLHAHVSVPGGFYNRDRSHKLAHVVRNLTKDSLWYQNALIMFSVNKTMRHLHGYRVLKGDCFVAVSACTDGASMPANACVKPAKVASKNVTRVVCSKSERYSVLRSTDVSNTSKKEAGATSADVCTKVKGCRHIEQCA
jgi:hypothetical protein